MLKSKLSKKKNKKDINFLLIGAPNVGKSTFFNKATTSNALVTNMDRITVEHTKGKIKNSNNLYLIDEPGIYNLSHPIDEEIEVSRDLMHGKFNGIINIIGAPSIKRDLYLTVQAIETGMLKKLVINMVDSLSENGVIDTEKMSKALNNAPIILAQTANNIGIKETLKDLENSPNIDDKMKIYPEVIENLITKISKILPETNLSRRFISLMILENNTFIIDILKEKFSDIIQTISTYIPVRNNYAELIHDSKLKYVEKIISICVQKQIPYLKKNKIKQNNFDKYILNKWIGIPFFILVVFLIYFITFSPWTGGFIKNELDYFLNDLLAQTWIASLFIDVFHANAWVTGFFVDGVFVGLFTVLSFIPVIIILFILISIIQQIGLLSRISVLLDNMLNKFGISGRSVVGLLTGFGCNVPAVMMARSSNSKKERIISVLITPFIACSARVIVFYFVAQAMFGSLGWVVMIGLTFLSGIIALFAGLAFSKILFRKQKSFFIVEMSEWKNPDLLIMVKTVWIQLREFLVKAVTIILLANIILWLLIHLGPAGAIGGFGATTSTFRDSFFGYFSYGLSFLFYPIFGVDTINNTPSLYFTASLIGAIPAKEIAISNMTIIFEGSTSFNDFFNPALNNGYNNIPAGLSYLVMIMLYTPCIPTMAVIKKETSWKYLFIHLGSAFGLAYILAGLTYWVSFGIMLI